MICDHYRRRDDNRAGELDPATFEHVEQFQTQPTYRLDWLVLSVWLGMFALGIGFWAFVAWLVL